MGELDKFSGLLEKAQKYSTTVGKVWLSVLFVFRLLVLKTAIGDVWDGEQSDFLCDTEQPGCQTVCYDKIFPISHPRFWMMQIIFISTPTLIYLGYVFHWVRKKEKEQETTSASMIPQTASRGGQSATSATNGHKDDMYKSNELIITYAFNVILKILLEVSFLVGHYFLYGFRLKLMYTCDRWPCLNKVYCYVPRPTEKTFFIVFMLLVASLSLVLNLAELCQLLVKYFRTKKMNKDLKPQISL